MSKRKIMAFILSLALVLGLPASAFAAGSPSTAPAPSKQNKVEVSQGDMRNVSTSSDGTAAATKVQNRSTVKVAGTVTVNGVEYKVTTLNAGAIGSKTKNVTISQNTTNFKKGAFKNAKNLKKLKLQCKKGAKASDYKFAKGAFNKKTTKKATIHVGKGMSKKEFNKLKKKLRSAGFRGKIKRG